MTDKPKPLTKEEIDLMRSGTAYDAEDVGSWSDRTIATIFELFDKVERLERYRERTRGMYSEISNRSANTIAAEEGIE